MAAGIAEPTGKTPYQGTFIIFAVLQTAKMMVE
jgi:hypothetical protein